MANVIEFKSDHVGETITQLSRVHQELSALAGRASGLQGSMGAGAGVRVSIHARLSTGVVSGSSASSALSALSRGIRAVSVKTESLCSALRTTCNKILETEAQLAGKRMMTTVQAAQALHYPTDTSNWTNAMWEEYYKMAEGSDSVALPGGGTMVQKEDGYYIYNADGRMIASFEKDTDWHSKELKYRVYGSDGSFSESTYSADLNILDKITLLKEKNKDFLLEDKDVTYYDKDGNVLTGDEAKKVKDAMEHERVATILEIGFAGGGKIGAFGQNWAYKNDSGFSASGNVEAATVEYKAGVKGGFYVEKVGPDGKTHLSFSPGISAEIGVDATLAHVDGKISQKLGDFMELSLEGSVDVGHAGLSAEAQLGMVDGKFAANVSAKAEANLIEAKASGSVDVGGVKGTVEGGVTVGIGAHAEIGYYDGHLKCDIGASLGIGVSVNVDLDISGAVDNVVNFVGDAVETVGSFCESAGEVLSSLNPFNWF